MWKSILLIIVSVAVSGCQAPQSPKARTLHDPTWQPALVKGDHGTFPARYDQIIRSWYAKNLKDPKSAVFERISVPRKEHAVTNQFRKEVVHGYSVCATVNAKNSYGGYSGEKQRWFLIRDHQIIRTMEARFRKIYIGRLMNCEDGEVPKVLRPAAKKPKPKIDQTARLVTSQAKLAKVDTLYVSSEKLMIRICPRVTCKATSYAFRGAKIDVLERRDGWARVSRYYEAAIEDDAPFRETGRKVARWMSLKHLSRQQPPLRIPPKLDSALMDPRIKGISDVGEFGMTKTDAIRLRTYALRLLKSGTCTGIEYGDKSESKPNTYYVNCKGEMKNRFFKPKDLE